MRLRVTPPPPSCPSSQAPLQAHGSHQKAAAAREAAAAEEAAEPSFAAPLLVLCLQFLLCIVLLHLLGCSLKYHQSVGSFHLASCRLNGRLEISPTALKCLFMVVSTLPTLQLPCTLPSLGNLVGLRLGRRQRARRWRRCSQHIRCF